MDGDGEGGGGQFWDYLGTILGPFWDHFGTFSLIFLDINMKIIKDIFFRLFLPRGILFFYLAGDGEGGGTILGSFWDHFGIIFKISSN